MAWTRVSFNPRPRAGGDVRVPLISTLDQSFNPRPRAGGDYGNLVRDVICKVSIHAPARGATNAAGWDRPVCQRFNPRPRAGGDTSPSPRMQQSSVFQSTPPRGGRQVWLSVLAVHNWFQSTPPRGGRQMWMAFYESNGWFQSTPPREGRRSQSFSPGCGSCFNPRPRARGDGKNFAGIML